ncbi:TIGR02453 family protein [Mariniphaga anaerophila]|uniref:TIGR02453 family protein n=1 Tax=Mariniphaga anaerophila TaxID=1484053 RepID=A0A1M5B7R0_9BACT|nr:DUF2461 domain-containing protein [Mariniphaga anaerophila]SHF38554.1 TIGR02453 family protein [Mariniphaga anaerophila]
MEKVLQFLGELAENNTREWFEKNRDRYAKSREKVLFITEILGNEIRKFDPEVPVLNPKDCMFRIFRDVRFSNDKRPYKTNFGSFIAKGGRKSQNPGYYFHIEPGKSFVGGGIYMPAAEPLKAIRKYIARFPEELTELLNAPEFKSVFPEMLDDKLKTAPKGFPKDHAYIHLLRYKSFAFSAPVSDSKIVSGSFIDEAVNAYKQLHRVNAYLYDSLRDIK